MKKSKKGAVNGSVISLFLAVIIVVGISILLWYWIRLQKEKFQTDENEVNKSVQITVTPTVTPTPIVLKQGDETYTISQGDHDGPTISEAHFSPLDVKGEPLEITVKVSDASPVVSMKAQLQSDSTLQTIALKN
jgi:heme/copper-type cytochrome/quinol oxidase subunit 2